MKKGRKTNISGTQLEKAVQTVLIEKGFEIEMYSKWIKNIKNYGNEILLKNAPFKTIYQHKGRTEFLLLSKKYSLKIRIECKWQQSMGSVDEKLPYLYLNTIEAMPEKDIIILIDGDGFKPGAKDWLRDAVKRKKYTTIKNNDTNILVFSLAEFFTWANNIFQ
ncbi:MAG: 4-diphosphocytidyl-2C-methyl-D-erythritol kinase [Candidatus Marinimicrobia bacterium]|nr:4-diphosphocytidyl-2C-methyl-D-erythritol kinase [Candidatus Neomarinimicrobiota bacterium]